MLNHFAHMRSVFKNPSPGDTRSQSSLLITRQGAWSMAHYAKDYGHHLSPALIVGLLWPHTSVVDGFAVQPNRRLNQREDWLPFERQSHDGAWNAGHAHAVRRAGHQHIGWWFHRERPVSRHTGLTPIAIRGLFARSEWDDLPRYSDLEERAVILLSWVEQRTLCLYAVKLNPATQAQQPMEIIWQGRH